MESSPQLKSLQQQIQSLTELHTRVQALHQFPSLLLRSNVASMPPLSLRAEFQQLKEIKDTILSDQIQDALIAARDSEKEDKDDIHFDGRRESRKRRRPPSPESPRPYVSFDRKSSSAFPVTDDELSPLLLDDLENYIREFNRSHKTKLHIWSRTRHPSQSRNSKVVRFIIPDVLTAYITLGYTHGNAALVIEGVTPFGPREKKAPHSQSDYSVYQNLSQYIANMIQSHPRVSVQSLIGLLCSYEGLFIDRCGSCERVLSTEGHTLPVARIWIDAAKEGESGKWEPKHITCQ